MPQAGALHCADVAGTFCEPDPQPDPPRETATAPMVECLAAHHGLSLEAYVALLYDALYGD